MRNKNDFEDLVYRKADVLAAHEKKTAQLRRGVFAAAAAFTVCTALSFGVFGNAVGVHSLLSARKNNTAAGFSNPDSSRQTYAQKAPDADEVPQNTYAPDDVSEYVYDYDNYPENDFAFDAAAEGSHDSVTGDVNSPEQNSSPYISPESSLPAENTSFPVPRAEYYKYNKLSKTIDAQSDINTLVRKLRNAEQVRDVNTDKNQTSSSSFKIITRDETTGAFHVKSYTVYSDYVYVCEYSQDNNTLGNAYNPENETYDKTYTFGISEEFEIIINEYFES